jgi:micrococcal nuclease
VRYLLVDTPELNTNGGAPDCFAAEARELNRRLVQNQEVTLTYDGEQCTDIFAQRALAYVWLGDRLVNEILLERGYARLLVPDPRPIDHAFPYEREEAFGVLEADAREAGKGLWGVCE